MSTIQQNKTIEMATTQQEKTFKTDEAFESTMHLFSIQFHFCFNFSVTYHCVVLQFH